MTFEEMPGYVMPLFFTVFAVNALYIASALLLQGRVQSVVAKAGREAPFNLFGGSPVELGRFLSFVYSGRHQGLDDPTVTRLTWMVRVLFGLGLVGTLGFFVFFFGLSQGAA